MYNIDNSQAKPTNYFGKLNVDSIVEWLKKKTGIPSNRIKTYQDLVEKSQKIDYLVVYFGPLHIPKFKLYLELARDFI